MWDWGRPTHGANKILRSYILHQILYFTEYDDWCLTVLLFRHPGGGTEQGEGRQEPRRAGGPKGVPCGGEDGGCGELWLVETWSRDPDPRLWLVQVSMVRQHTISEWGQEPDAKIQKARAAAEENGGGSIKSSGELRVWKYLVWITDEESLSFLSAIAPLSVSRQAEHNYSVHCLLKWIHNTSLPHDHHGARAATLCC